MGDRSLAPKLAGGISGMIAAEIVPSLWSLARQLEQLGLADVVLQQPPQAALAELRASPPQQPVMAQFDAFLARHGHRCMSEAEWLHPRWIEAPELVIESIASYLRAGDSFDPTGAVANAEQERLAGHGGRRAAGESAAAGAVPLALGPRAPLHAGTRQRPALPGQADAAGTPALCDVGRTLGRARLAGASRRLLFLGGGGGGSGTRSTSGAADGAA